MKKSRGFDFTVAAMADPVNLNIDQEMTYIKIALLYADKINIISPLAHLYLQLTDARHSKNELQAMKIFDKLKPYIFSYDEIEGQRCYDVIDEMRSLISKPQYRIAPKRMKDEVRVMLRQFINEINSILDGMLGAANIDSLKLLVKHKRINILNFERNFVDSDDFVQEFFSKLVDSLHNSYPLFDAECANLISCAIREGIIEVSDFDKRRSAHAGLAQDLMIRLPSLEFAPVDEILDIRKVLDKSLTRFRAKMVQFSSGIESIPGDKNFDAECEELYVKEVLPALLEIEEHFKDTSFRSNLGRKFLQLDLTSMGSLCFTLASAGTISSLSGFLTMHASLLVAGSAWSAHQTIQAFYEYCRGKTDASRKELYFYYQAGKKL